MRLWLVEIDDRDFEYDYFVSAVVWAETAIDAEAQIRESPACDLPKGEATRLQVRPAPVAGVAHAHHHPG